MMFNILIFCFSSILSMPVEPLASKTRSDSKIFFDLRNAETREEAERILLMDFPEFQHMSRRGIDVYVRTGQVDPQELADFLYRIFFKKELARILSFGKSEILWPYPKLPSFFSPLMLEKLGIGETELIALYENYTPVPNPPATKAEVDSLPTFGIHPKYLRRMGIVDLLLIPVAAFVYHSEPRFPLEFGFISSSAILVTAAATIFASARLGDRMIRIGRQAGLSTSSWQHRVCINALADLMR